MKHVRPRTAATSRAGELALRAMVLFSYGHSRRGGDATDRLSGYAEPYDGEIRSRGHDDHKHAPTVSIRQTSIESEPEATVSQGSDAD